MKLNGKIQLLEMVDSISNFDRHVFVNQAYKVTVSVQQTKHWPGDEEVGGDSRTANSRLRSTPGAMSGCVITVIVAAEVAAGGTWRMPVGVWSLPAAMLPVENKPAGIL